MAPHGWRWHCRTEAGSTRLMAATAGRPIAWPQRTRSWLMSRLLVLSCSLKKRADPGVLPAIERYDGPCFRVLRRYLRGSPAAVPEVRLLSAEYGLLRPDELLPVYDRRMTASRSRELAAQV